jgi:hypothetical protein
MWEFIYLLSEREKMRATLGPAPKLISPRYQINFNGIFYRILISIVSLWIFGSGIIIRVGMPDNTPFIAIVTDGCLIVVSLVTFYALWQPPDFVHTILLRSGVLITACSIITFTSLFNYIPKSNVSVLQEVFIMCFIFVIPSALLFLFLALTGRKHIYLANFANQFSDEIPE